MTKRGKKAVSPAGKISDDDDDGVADHRLCGYLRTVVAIAPPLNSQTLPTHNTRCKVSINGSNGIEFECENGVVLVPIASSSSRKRWSRIGMVQGSLSVVRQAQALLINRCLRIIARVIGVSAREDHVRVLVLVDVYLPNTVWSGTPGWQFPKSGPIAAAFFKHLSCDWEARQLMLASSEPGLSDCEIWNVPDCHAVDCKHQCSVPEAPVGKFFELHEIFKSLPSVMEAPNLKLSSAIYPATTSVETGFWQLSDDVIIQILSSLAPADLFRVSASCHHLGSLAATIIPCGKLRLFPHQQAAVDWMLMREQGPRVLQDPFYAPFFTEDGFDLFINVVSGKIVAGATAPSVSDFRGGMFCDEPGLGKTVTALSLILKTQGTLAHPPEGAQVSWCNHNSNQRCAYYEVRTQNLGSSRGSANKSRRGQFGQNALSPSQSSDICTPSNSEKSGENSCGSGMISEKGRPRRFPVSASNNSHQAQRNLLNQYEEASVAPGYETPRRSAGKRKQAYGGTNLNSLHCGSGESLPDKRKRPKMVYEDDCLVSETLVSETWVQCEGCGKWRKLVDATIADTSRAWFCSMNNDPLHQNCNVPEETDKYESITYFPGFCAKGSPGGLEENISFFIGVLKEHKNLLNYKTDKVLKWLVKLSPDKLSEMETVGLPHSVSQLSLTDGEHEYHKLFQAFGLIKKVEKGVTRWYYPRTITNLVFDMSALVIALDEPLDSSRFYLSRATLIVVPANLVDHWKTQIQKHVSRGQLRVYVWNEPKKSQKKPSPHHLAWDYDVVITTFSRLSAEWSQRQRSTLMQVHWLRVILDEGHTLGSSLSLTNKLQMAVFLRASSRWVLTGTPTPNTPSSQLSHLHPMLKFLHEESYGLNQKSWEDGILRPFEAEMEEGRLRLLQLLQRCMISARKADLKSIPPCIKRVTFLDFTEEHAKTYNELLETVRRNILLADWNDPSHVESLLNPKQWKFRSAAIRNLRLSCCVAGHIRVADAGQDIQETMDILQETGLDQSSQEYQVIKFNILYGGNCVRCKEWCRLPLITPCRHLLCLDCVALESTGCPLAGCGRLYEMQSPDTLTRPENPNPKWPVPKDLIELQPSYKQDDWHPDWQSTSSSKVSYLVNRLKLLRETNGLVGSSHEEKGVKSPEKFYLTPQKCNFYNNQQPDDVVELRCQSTSKIPEKAIIFSQFLEHIHVIEQQLTIAGIQYAGMYNPMPSANKMTSLATFQNDANCMALLMDGSAALGLDLSFVTHVYLMEPIWDKSMEEQVISRAHRMGATRPISVETLAMSGTIEEQMLKFLDADDSKRLLKDESSKHDGDTARVHRTLHDLAESNYLTRLKFVRTN